MGLLRRDRLLEKARRIFEFGFAVGNSRVEIATITDSFKLHLKNGSYKVRVQLWSERAGTDLCYVSFLENSPAQHLGNPWEIIFFRLREFIRNNEDNALECHLCVVIKNADHNDFPAISISIDNMNFLHKLNADIDFDICFYS